MPGRSGVGSKKSVDDVRADFVGLCPVTHSERDRERARACVRWKDAGGPIRGGSDYVSFSPVRGTQREPIDYKTSMITDEDPLRGLLFY